MLIPFLGGGGGGVVVTSTGGGACLRLANREHLNTRSHVIYLQTPPEILYSRLRGDKTRPLLQVRDPLAKLQELYAARHPLYLETAHHVLETSRLTKSRILNQISRQLELTHVNVI